MGAGDVLILFSISAIMAVAVSKEVELHSDVDLLQSNKLVEFDSWTQHHHDIGWVANFVGDSSTQVSGSEGCENVNLCCEGKDNNCAARGRKLNKQDNGICYCDSSCLALGDCCLDYTKHCPATDCLLSGWGEWNDCDVRCGLGVRQRSREISQKSKNGGKACAATVQKQVCDGSHCKQTRASDEGKEMREIGRILQSEFSRWRTNILYDPYKDIRRNIFLNSQSVPSKSTYCAVYRVNSVNPSCGGGSISGESVVLKIGDEICVECQPTAMQQKYGGRCFGHGVIKRVTRWDFLGKTGCRGTWTMEVRKEDCLCQLSYPSVPSYSFV